jgi:hypothetical protein
MDGTFLTPLKSGMRDDWLDECPYCEGNNLHHSDVTVFNRSEDADTVRVTHVMHDSTITSARIPNDSTNNPSSRRDGILIHFWCEHCEEKPVMAILQHKGTTFIGWRK